MEAGGTEPALIGPFWRANQPLRRNGERISSDDTPGARLTVRGRVLSLDGRPIGGARVETWQALPLSDTALDTKFLDGSRQVEFRGKQFRLKLLSILLHEINHLVSPRSL